MSITVTSRVWKHSRQKGTHLLILLALADWCNEESVCWPLMSTLAERGRVKERNAQTIVANLQSKGEIYRSQARGRGHSNLFAVLAGLSRYEVRAILANHFKLDEKSIAKFLKKVQKPAPQEKVQGLAPEGAVSRQKGRKGLHPGVQKNVRKGAKACTQNHQQPSKEPSKNRQQQPRPSPVVDAEIIKLLDKLGIEEPTRTELAAKNLTPDYLDKMIEHKKAHSDLGAGYYVKRIRAGDNLQVKRKHWWDDEYDQYVNR